MTIKHKKKMRIPKIRDQQLKSKKNRSKLLNFQEIIITKAYINFNSEISRKIVISPKNKYSGSFKKSTKNCIQYK